MGDTRDSIKVILLDIAGTATPTSFFSVTLPNYAKEHLREFLEKFHSIPEIKSYLADLKRMHSEDVKAGSEPPAWNAKDLESDLNSIMDYCIWLIDRESSARPLNHLEGLVWEVGYRTGKLRGEVYPEVPEVLSKWKELGLETCTYSSGSVFSQQLIFGSTKYGNLMPLIKGYFDTSVGSMSSPQSYTHIASILRLKPSQIIFFSSSIDDAIAAKKAGLNVALIVRGDSVGRGEQDITTLPDLAAFNRARIASFR